MNLLETILSSRQGDAVGQVAQRFGLGQDQAVSAISSLVPALSSGIMRNISSGDGLQSLLSALASGSHQRYLEDTRTLNEPETIADGNGILGHILGSKDVSRMVARSAATQTGIGEDILKKMLPIVAGMVMGAMSRQTSPLGAQTPQQPNTGGDLLGTLSSFLDANRDGSAADDVLGMIGKLFQK